MLSMAETEFLDCQKYKWDVTQEESDKENGHASKRPKFSPKGKAPKAKSKVRKLKEPQQKTKPKKVSYMLCSRYCY